MSSICLSSLVETFLAVIEALWDREEEEKNVDNRLIGLKGSSLVLSVFTFFSACFFTLLSDPSVRVITDCDLD